MKNVAYVAFLSIYTLFVLLLRGGFPCEESEIRHRDRSVVIRILRSVRSELIDSSAKLREVNVVYEGLTKTIPEKRRYSFHSSIQFLCANIVLLELELSSLLDEIESAKRTLRELQDRRNVRVFLPHSILYPDTRNGHNRVHLTLHSSLSSLSLESSVDYSSVFRSTDYGLFLGVPDHNDFLWNELPSLLPFSRTYLVLIVITAELEESFPFLPADLSRLTMSALSAGDRVQVLNCSTHFDSESCFSQLDKYMRDSSFCVLLNSKDFSRLFWESLRLGCIPVVTSMDIVLPFQGNLDWRLASVRIALARFPELHFVLRSFDMPEVLEMRRIGRVFFERYLCDQTVVVRALLASLRERLGLPSPAEDVVTYSYQYWNTVGISGRAPEFMAYSVDPPTESEFYPDSNIGFRPIEPGSGIEFSKALGGNRVREQFTVVLLTYNRDSVLSASLERLHRLPYLNKVIVIWNNVAREPLGAWPRLHVPVEFIKVSNNSLNNRFVPWDRIRTEAVLSLDDDIDLKQHEIVFAFRVWRENRHRIVGFPARHHARYGDQMYYNSNHTCQLSIILTGAAFLHKSYLHAYTHQMPEAIRRHVDEVTNCEDIAMNFLVAHITREAPIKTTSKWTLKCPTCSEMLSQDESHFTERHDCIRFFTKVYGYNPLKFSQFRADSVLFKTRLPPDKQKCFRFV
ncbi:unnamed protein product [Angiostrongylus costaricensis]|uniref:Glyco_transf_64 domain-containing protein n=1 Tax=Angiostrongylus costaricensis TaxID=334426 RepID=A0A158PKS4_ANGCS|nr:unnamed protein product [Angiostrongylus costaricensis]